ncbi:sigma-54-dependent Fis family transcriptional regulator [Acidisoma cellulosilytica]|uniref:Sigma-54-dependent Fis family transcriptional regulator n=1 Tax=Acidisoma cellulosilyticum TaxID=2802395 RepID=A0A963Z6R0_9PROT|nr:sigma 54-interacting transcriptional regulator [Acidisoma cellulosilyticum]MCB8883554.1 sigma-54-dependent Fis family transcriptional regulator [Acidisoma cellulosilyticum]
MPGPQPDPQGLRPFNIQHGSAGRDTMCAWERFLTEDPQGTDPVRNVVVSSWLRSRELGINPRGRSAPLAARGDAMDHLRDRHADLLGAAADVFAMSAPLLGGSRSLMLLTNPDGIVLDAIGDNQTLDAGQSIHLMQGGDWREDTVGTNGIGTALATRRPAQVHASEHFCEGIKAWTCAAAPIFELGTGQVLGILDISGPTTTYQRNNLSLAVSIARQIEMVLNERASRERMRLLEVCLERLSARDVAGLVAIDRDGRLVHNSGRLSNLVPLGHRLPGLDRHAAVEDWALALPAPLSADWFDVIRVDGRAIGAVLVIPEQPSPRSAPVDLAEAGFGAIIGRSPALAQALTRVRQLRGKRVPILIEGETGTGKELFARALHGEVRDSHPFVVFNCGAVVKDLLASELFGYIRGAFTGATAAGAIGRFEQAHGGTLCLDEIGEMPLDLQSILLRVLEDGIIYRLGSGQPHVVDVRLVAMTNRNLLEEVAAGRFRRDLYHRLSVTRIQPPPLRDRTGDVDLLIAHFNRLLAARHGVSERMFEQQAMRLLRDYDWPGNVRELRNLVESLLLMSETASVTEEELVRLLEPAAIHSDGLGAAQHGSASLEDAERVAIIQATGQCHGNLAEAARALRISRSTLYRKMDRYGLSHR